MKLALICLSLLAIGLAVEIPVVTTSSDGFFKKKTVSVSDALFEKMKSDSGINFDGKQVSQKLTGHTDSQAEAAHRVLVDKVRTEYGFW